MDFNNFSTEELLGVLGKHITTLADTEEHLKYDWTWYEAREEFGEEKYPDLSTPVTWTCDNDTTFYCHVQAFGTTLIDETGIERDYLIELLASI